MAERKITYTIIADDQTKQTFDEVSKSTKKMSDDSKSIGEIFKNSVNKNVKDFGATLRDLSEKEVKGLGNEFEKLHKKHFTLASAFKDTIGLVVNLGMTALKTTAAMALIGYGLTHIDKLIKTVGGTSTAAGGFLAKFGEVWAKISGYANNAKTAILTNIPLLKDLATIGTLMFKSFNIGASGIKNFEATFKLSDFLPKYFAQFAEAASTALFNLGKSFYNVSTAAKSITATTGKVGDVLGKAGDVLGKVGNSAKTVGGIFNQLTYPLRKLSPAFKDLWSATTATWDATRKLAGPLYSLLNFTASAVSGFIKVLVKVPVAGLLAAIAIETLIVNFKKIIRLASELDALQESAQMVDFNIGAYKAWDIELRKAGSSMADMEQTISGLSTTIIDAASGTGRLSQAFKELGIKAVDNKGYLKDNQTIFTEIISKLAAMTDSALRNAYAAEIFGRNYRKLLPILDGYNTGVAENIKSTEKFNKVLALGAAAGSEFTDKIQDLKGLGAIFNADLFTGTINRLSDTLTIIQNSQIGDVFYALAKVVVWAINLILDAFNTVIGAIGLLTSSVVYGWKKIVTGVLEGYWLLINTLNKTPLFGKKIIPDEAVEDARQKFIAMAGYADEAYKMVMKSGNQFSESLIQLATLGIVNFAPKAGTKSTGKTKPPPRPPKDTDKTGLEEMNKAWDKLKEYYSKRDQIIEQYNQVQINNIVNQFTRERAITKDAYDKKLKEINQNLYDGYTTEEEAAKARVELEKWVQAENLKTGIAGTEQYIQRLKDNKEKVIKITQGYADAFAPLNDNWVRLIDLMNQSNDASGASLANMSTGFAAVGESLMAVSDHFGNIKDSATAVAGIVNNAITAMANNTNQAAMDSVGKWYDKQKKVVEDTVRGERRKARMLAALEDEKNKKTEQARKDSFERNKIASVLEAIIATSLAIVKSLPNWPLAIAVGALGAAQVGIIASQKFARGGIVDYGSTTGDTTTARVNKGEMILNPSQQAQLFNIANGSKSGGTTTINAGIVINGNADKAVIEEAHSKQVYRLKQTLREMNANGDLRFLRIA